MRPIPALDLPRSNSDSTKRRIAAGNVKGTTASTGAARSRLTWHKGGCVLLMRASRAGAWAGSARAKAQAPRTTTDKPGDAKNFYQLELLNGGNWLSEVGLDAVEEDAVYESQLGSKAKRPAFIHGMSDLPTPDEWESLQHAPEPDTYTNPPEWQKTSR